MKCYDDFRRVEKKPIIFVTEHLSKPFLEQKKLLMPYFKDAQRNQLKTSWRAENGEYVLYDDIKKVSAPPSTAAMCG